MTSFRRQRNVKIVATLGPASDTYEMIRSLFVAGAHTDVGKTYVSCALITAARGRGLMVEALKPLVSGFDAGDWSQSDPGRLLIALGRPHSQAALEAISPWRYVAPLAPPLP